MWGKIQDTAIVATLFLLSSCAGCPGSVPEGAVPVVVQAAVERDSSPQVTAFGLIQPSNRADVVFPTAVKVDQVFVKVGDMVNVGTPLLKLSDEDITGKLTQLRAAKKEADATYEKNTYLLKNRDKLLEEGKIDRTQHAGLESEVKAEEAGLERLKTDIAALEFQLNGLTITSGLAGQVIDRSANPGMPAEAKQILLSVAVMDPATIVFPVAVDDAPGIAIGTPVSIKLEDVALPPIQSSVSYVGPTVNPTSKTFDAWATMPNPQGILKMNMRGTVDYTSSVTHKVAVIPASSVMTKQHHAFVFVVKNGIARNTQITIRQMTPNDAIVGSGLSAGDLVVAKGWEKLQDGSPVDLRR